MCIKIGFFYGYQHSHWHILSKIKKSLVLLASYCRLCQLINPLPIKIEVNNLKLVVMQSVS